ncbi:holin family protein [Roseovarius amoyensis]|uniref:holin family protein n=1 Tax=Roseovarius amoyensis TaxID=2211448 RepID=UPI0019551410|nr:holin family protein [Roseovarius amoyensis]
MGLIADVLSALLGNGRNVVAETTEVFRVNAEAADARAATIQSDALAQLAAEFAVPRRGLFDRLIDGLNRVPRPAMALGTLGLFLSAMIDPAWFSARMQGIQLVPEPLWWLLGAIVSFYFGARHQAQGQEFQRSLALTMARTPQVMANIAELGRLSATSPRIAANGPDAALELGAVTPGGNPALDDWRRAQQGGAATM